MAYRDVYKTQRRALGLGKDRGDRNASQRISQDVLANGVEAAGFRGNEFLGAVSEAI